MLFQDEQTVAFPPLGFEEPDRYQKLIVLYGVTVLAFAVYRGFQLMFLLRKLRLMQKADPNVFEDYQSIWQEGWWKTQTLAKLSVLTFFLSVFAVSMSLINLFLPIAWDKTTHAYFVFEGIANKLIGFSFGMLVCIGLYASGFFFESRLNRCHRASNRQKNSKSSAADLQASPTD